jgi:hypothetical protein
MDVACTCCDFGLSEVCWECFDAKQKQNHHLNTQINGRDKQITELVTVIIDGAESKLALCPRDHCGWGTEERCDCCKQEHDQRVECWLEMTRGVEE